MTETSSSVRNGSIMQTSAATTVMTGSNLSYDTEEMYGKSDDDNLESLRKKVTNFIIDTASSNSSNRTILHKNVSPLQTTDSKSEVGEKNNNIKIDSDEEEVCDGKKFNYLVRTKR